QGDVDATGVGQHDGICGGARVPDALERVAGKADLQVAGALDEDAAAGGVLGHQVADLRLDGARAPAADNADSSAGLRRQIEGGDIEVSITGVGRGVIAVEDGAGRRGDFHRLTARDDGRAYADVAGRGDGQARRRVERTVQGHRGIAVGVAHTGGQA